MKTCTKCEKTKPLDDFPARRDHSRDGLHTECKECRRRYMREYIRAWRKANPDRAKEGYHRGNHSKAGRERDARYKARNRDRLRARAARRRKEKAELVKEQYHRWRASHREQEIDRLHRRRAATNEQFPAEVAVLLTQPCSYCGSTEKITIDHIVPLSRGGKHEPENLAAACTRCNYSKGAKLLSEWTTTSLG